MSTKKNIDITNEMWKEWGRGWEGEVEVNIFYIILGNYIVF
jgi:hypothetical protein